MGRQVYENLKVLDVTNNYAGPMAGAMLADYGAEVWHVEKPVLGDDNRYFPPTAPPTEARSRWCWI